MVLISEKEAKKLPGVANKATSREEQWQAESDAVMLWRKARNEGKMIFVYGVIATNAGFSGFACYSS